MDDLQKRIDRAWNGCKDWITRFEGSPTEAFLMDVSVQALMPALQGIAQQTENFRISTISGAQPDQATFISLDSLQENIDLLQRGDLAELNINYAVRSEAFDLDIHSVLYLLDKQRAALEFIWWADQVFSEETDNYQQFKALMMYFIELQNLFQARTLLVSPEIGIRSGQEVENGVEV